MRKFAIASLLVAGVALSGSVLAQDAAPQAAPATPSAAAQPASSSSHHHHNKKSNKASTGQPKQKGSKSAKRTAKSTLPQTTASH